MSLKWIIPSVVVFLYSIAIHAQDESDEIDYRVVSKLVHDSTIEFDQNMASLVINGDIQYLKGKYILDFISLGSLAKSDLRILRNTIFAQYGYIFTSRDLAEHFSKFTWYKPTRENVDDLLTNIDKRNLEMISAFEEINSDGKESLDDSKLLGLWHIMLEMPAGFERVFQFYEDGTFRYRYSQMRELPIIISFSGRYRIEGNTLVLNVLEKEYLKHGDKVNYSGAFGYQWDVEERVKVSDVKTLRYPIGGIFRADSVVDYINDSPEAIKARDTIQVGSINFFRYSDDPDNYK